MDDTRFRSDRGGDQPYPAEEEYQDSDVPNYAAEEHYQDNEVPRARRHGLALVMAIFGLALVGSACAVGYRNIFVGSVSPTLPPAIKAINTIASVSEPQAQSSGNARQIGPVDPQENIEAGTHYLSDLLQLYKHDLALTLAAYNAGPERVQQYGQRVPPFAETISYIHRVQHTYQQRKSSGPVATGKTPPRAAPVAVTRSTTTPAAQF